MAPIKNHTGAAEANPHTALIDRLIDHADGIDNVAAHGLEVDLRAAAKALQEAGAPPAPLARLNADLIRARSTTTDEVTRAILAGLIGERQ